jgi:hypothetical protein
MNSNKNKFFVLLFLGIIILVSWASEEEKPIENIVAAWEDEEGNNKEDYGVPADLASVIIAGEDNFIKINISFYTQLKPIFNRADSEGNLTGFELITFYFDIDNDSTTGNSGRWVDTFEGSLEGYEYNLTVSSGYDYIRKDSDNAGSVAGNIILNTNELDITDNFAGIKLIAYKENGMYTTIDEKPDGNMIEIKEFAILEDTIIKIKLPYNIFKLNAGDEIKLCFQDGVPFSSEISENKILILK